MYNLYKLLINRPNAAVMLIGNYAAACPFYPATLEELSPQGDLGEEHDSGSPLGGQQEGRTPTGLADMPMSSQSGLVFSFTASGVE